ncbi:MAG: hypothetical protein OEV81_14715 [Betaproteobacteria bacterium]|nr:hypothetical protein [Betaproteobacteria bacterium]MDH5352052.1 hypothetical protein [Betaproteobacteria bacterium]
MRVLLALAIAAGTVSPPALAQQVAGAFSQGRTHLYVSGGAGSAFGESYVVIGAGVDYFLLDGLSAGLAFESWSGADPGFTKITPSVRYVFYGMQAVKPYVGAFYRRTDIDGLPSLDSTGGRAGVFVQAGRNAYLGFGVTYESYLDCQPSVYADCDSTYPELSFAVVF